MYIKRLFEAFSTNPLLTLEPIFKDVEKGYFQASLTMAVLSLIKPRENLKNICSFMERS